MRDTIKLGVILALFCAIAGASLAVVHAITSDIIAARQEQELMSRLQELAPQAERFEKMQPEAGGTYYLGWRSDAIVGAILEGSAKGYGGDIRLLVAVDAEGKVSGIRVIEHSETIGIGARALQPEFLQQFSGHAHDEPLVAGKNVDVIAGATVSSRAVMSSITNALELYKTEVLRINTDDGWDLAKVPDGVYEGTAQGYKSEIKVKVTVAAGRITAVDVVSIADTPEVYPDAVEQVNSTGK